MEDHEETELGVEQSMDDYIDKTTANPQENNHCEDTNMSHVPVELELERLASDDENSVDRTEYENCLDDSSPSRQESLEFFNEKISDGKRIKTRSKSLELFYVENFANIENSDGSGGKRDVENVTSDNETPKKLKSESSIRSFETGNDTRNNEKSNNCSNNDTEDSNKTENSENSVSINRNPSNNNNNNNNNKDNSDNKSNQNNSDRSNINNSVNNNHNNNKNSNKGLWEITKALNAYDLYMSQSSLDELSCIEEEGTFDEESSEQSENEIEESKNDRLEPEYKRDRNKSSNENGFREKDFFNNKSSNNEMSNEPGLRNSSFLNKNSLGKGLSEHQTEKLSVQEKPNHQRLDEGGNGLEVNGFEEEDSDVDESEWETDEENEGSGNEERGQLADGGNSGRRAKVYFNDSREYNGDEDNSDEEETKERKEPRKGERNNKEDSRMSINGSRRYHDDVDDGEDDSYEETSEYSSEEEMSDSSVEQKKVAII